MGFTTTTRLFILLLAGFLAGQRCFADYPSTSLACYEAVAAASFNAASTHCRQAAQQGATEAQFKLAELYALGRGTEKDLGKAVKWLTAAAQEGHVEAQYNLGLANYHGSGLAQNYKIVADWYRDAALEGHALAQRNLAHMYELGEGVSLDSHKAFLWYLKTAKQGHSRDQLKVGLMLLEGEGVAINTEEAAVWITRSAQSGDADAQFVLGKMLFSIDSDEAIAWYRKSSSQMHVLAMYNLALYLSKETASLPDLKEARQLTDDSIKGGNQKSIALMADIEQRISASSENNKSETKTQPPAIQDRFSNLNVRWLMNLTPENYTIQLVSLSSIQRAEKFILRYDLKSMARHFPVERKEKLMHVVIYGEFDSGSDATQALQNLPEQLRQTKPFIRQIKVLQSNFISE